MRAPERLAIGAASRMENNIGIIDYFGAGLVDLITSATDSARRCTAGSEAFGSINSESRATLAG
jgi:hypothetical protein